MNRLTLQLQTMPPMRGPAGDGYNGKLPTRFGFLEPAAAKSLLEVESKEGRIVCTDMWRSAESSLQARASKRGVQRPGYSGHNFGDSIDADLDTNLRERKMKYIDFVAMMQRYGWCCHRRDGYGPDVSEAWHFNYFGPDPGPYLALTDPTRPVTWAAALEKKVQEQYGTCFTLGTADVQTLLSSLGLYHGEADGEYGPQMREAVKAFQRAWTLDEDGVAGLMTQRTLAFVAADKNILPAL